MNEFDVGKYLQLLYEELLLNGEPKKIDLTANWCQTFPSKPGVYLFRDKSKIIYVGETGNLSLRMADLRRTVNHTLRRNIGNTLFSKIDGWTKATSRNKFNERIEAMLDEHFRSNLTIAVLPVRLGRCELEEKVISIHRPEYNYKGKRVSL